MQVKLDFQIYKWLLGLNIIQQRPQIKMLSVKTGKIELDQEQSQQLMDGFLISDILQKFKLLINPVQLKTVTSIGLRLFNWNILTETLKKIGMQLDNDIKLLIVQGDVEMINELLIEIKENLDHNFQNSRIETLKSAGSLSKKSLSPLTRNKNKINESYIIENTPDHNVLSLDYFEAEKPLNQANSLLELIIISLCKNLSLNPSQGTSLLANGNKLLSHVLVKGYKNSFDTILKWLNEISIYIPQISKFLIEKPEQINNFLSILRGGLLSKSLEITVKCLSIYQQVFIEMKNNELFHHIFDWFIQEHGGLFTTYLSLKRHIQCVDQITNIYRFMWKNNINEFFNVQIRKLFEQSIDFIDFLNLLWDSLINFKEVKNNPFLIESWCKIALKYPQNDLKSTTSEKMKGLQFLVNYWISSPTDFEKEENRANEFLFMMKKSSRDHSQSLRYFVMQNLFRLLDHLAMSRNAYASIIYKKITFSFIENFQDYELRDFISQNFLYILKRYDNIPIDILALPFVRQIKYSKEDGHLNISDFGLIKAFSLHPKLQKDQALQLLEILLKIYLSTVIFANIAFQSVQLLLNKFAENEEISMFAYDSVVNCLQVYENSFNVQTSPKFKKFISNNHRKFIEQSTQNYVSNQSKNNDGLNQLKELSIIQAQKRSLIVEYIKFVVGLKASNLNEQLKSILVSTYLRIQKNPKGAGMKGIESILSLYGNIEEVLSEIKFQMLERQKTQQKLNIQQNQIEQEPPMRFSITPEQAKNQSNHVIQQYRTDILGKNKSNFQLPKIDKPKDTEILSKIQLNSDEQELLKQFELL